MSRSDATDLGDDMRRADDARRAPALDRRAFLAATAGAAAAAAVAPLSARAMGLPLQREIGPSADAGASSACAASPVADSAWDIDDMWGHAPRYAHPIPYSPARNSPVDWERVEPIDRMLVI